jgi:serine/threonine protein kinase
LSLENILLTDKGGVTPQVKLIDFGMLSLQRKCMREKRGKRSYQAPEMHLENEYYDAYLTDAFAVGVIAFTMVARDYPWLATKPGVCKCFDYVASHSFERFLERRLLRRGDGKHLIEILTPAFAKFVSGLLRFDPNKRSTLGESCWDEDGASRLSVWNTQWLKSEAVLAQSCVRPCSIM